LKSSPGKNPLRPCYDGNMPKGPQGQKRSADVVVNAVHVMKIATGEAEEQLPSKRRTGGLKGGKARAKVLSDDERRKIAQKAAKARWGKQG
jgi:hypothetical protein